MYSDFVDRLVYPGDGEPRLLTYAQVSGNFFDVFDVRPALGSGFDREETWARDDGFGAAALLLASVASVAVVVGVVALVACWTPARLATRTDPVETLRSE